MPKPPSAWTSRRVLPAALVVSLAAHGVALGLMLKQWRDARPAASVGRHKGELQVTLRRTPAAAPPSTPVATPAASPAPAPTVERNTKAAAPRKQRARSDRPAASPKPAAAVAAAESTPPPEPVPAASAPVPGAQFANLFAPIVHAPMGQARWSSTRAPTPMPPDLQRLQALTALRAELASRLASLAEQLRVAQAQVACDLVVDIERRIGQIECEDGQQQALAWGHLQGTLVAGLVSQAAQRLCLRLSGQQVQDTGCAATSPAP